MAQKQFKDGLGLNDTVQIDIQVALVVQALAEYVVAEWSAPAVSQLMYKLQEEILDPVFYKERQAEMQGERDRQEEVVKRMTGLNLPGMFRFPDDGDQT